MVLKNESKFLLLVEQAPKTFLINLLKNQVNRCYGKTVVNVRALIGGAARLVGGPTLHRLLNYQYKNMEFLPKCHFLVTILEGCISNGKILN